MSFVQAGMADEKSGVPERATGALLAPRPTSKSLDPDTALRPVIHESWRRCTAAHLDPEPARLEVRRVAADELDRRIERNAELLEVARPHLAWLSSAFASVEHLAAIVDLDGVVLHTTGTDAGAIASIGAPGHEWSEALMGTNGIGTAIVAGAPVAVSGAEHFVRPLHCFACTGAPIRDASGRIAGAINLTSREPEAPAGRLTVVAHAAYAIEQELRHRESLRGTRGTLDSERRLAEALRQSEARFRSLSASSPVGIFQADSEGFVTYANARVLQIFALSEEEGLGHGWISRIHPEDAQAVISGWSAALQRQAEYNHEYRLLMPDGTINWVHCRSAPMFDGAGAMIGNVGTIEDITVRRALESQLRQAQKMEAVGQLAGGVAHDFNNLLTVIKVHAELALDELQASHPLHTDLVEVRKAADRASGLTRQLLAFSRKQLLQPEVLNLNEVVAGLEPMLRRLIGEDIRVLAELDQSIARVHADPGQLEQVIVNLAVNARDAMADGGTLTIRTCEVAMSDADVRRHAGMGAGRYVVLEVVDTGCGMTPEVRERIFEPFFTTKSAGTARGSGWRRCTASSASRVAMSSCRALRDRARRSASFSRRPRARGGTRRSRRPPPRVRAAPRPCSSSRTRRRSGRSRAASSSGRATRCSMPAMGRRPWCSPGRRRGDASTSSSPTW